MVHIDFFLQYSSFCERLKNSYMGYHGDTATRLDCFDWLFVDRKDFSLESLEIEILFASKGFYRNFLEKYGVPAGI